MQDKLKSIANSLLFPITKSLYPDVIIFRKEYSRRETLLSVFAIILVASLNFFIYFYPVSLHDISHYLIAAISNYRDGKEILYPYNALSADHLGPAYKYFQENSIVFDIRTSFPSKLYTLVLSIGYLLTDEMRFLHIQIINYITYIFIISLIYMIGRAYLGKFLLAIFIATIIFSPLMRFMINPGNDTFGLLGVVVLIWLICIAHVNTFITGLIMGILMHFRAQSLALIPAAIIIYFFMMRRDFFYKDCLKFLFGSFFSYLFLNVIFSYLIQKTGSPLGSISFYINFYKSSFYGFQDYPLVLRRFADNIFNIFKVESVSIFAVLGVIGIWLSRSRLIKAISFAGIFCLLFPIFIYSLDRYSNPHLRYYIPGYFLLLYSWFLLLESTRHRNPRIVLVTSVSTLLLSVCSWFYLYGIPISHVSSLKIIEKRLSFLDFRGSQSFISSNFDGDSIVLSNHSIPTALGRLKNLIYIPSRQEFESGDNREIDGLFFVFSEVGPNSFFKPADWFVDGKMPDTIIDSHGVVFDRLYYESSSFPVMDANDKDAETFLMIYKNRNPVKTRHYTSGGIRYAENKPDYDLQKNRLEESDFRSLTHWNANLTEVLPSSNGVLVGPGPNKNFLYQEISVVPGEKLRVTALAVSPVNQIVKGRLQINWLDSKRNFISTNIEIIDVMSRPQEFTMTVNAPPDARFAFVFVSPHGEVDQVRYFSTKVFGK